MARPISDEELQLKRRARRRLIGAIVLVAAIVVVLPMVLDTEPRPLDGEISIKIPPPDSSKFTSRMVPVPPSAEPRSASREGSPPDAKSSPKLAAAMGEKAAGPDAAKAPAPSPAAKASPPGAADAPSRTAVAPKAQQPAVSENPVKPAATAAADEAASQTYAVQVAALADAEKVRQVQAQMAAAGVKSYTETVKTAKGEVTRVRAGPFPSRAAAEKAHDQLKTLGLGGNIVAQ
jgi:DedD protein